MSSARASCRSANRDLYRDWAWDQLETTTVLKETLKSARILVLLEETEALETFFLVKRGYDPSQLIIAQESAGKTAEIRKVLKSKNAETVRLINGGKTSPRREGGLARVAARLVTSRTRVHAIHADFCCTAARAARTLASVRQLAYLGPLAVAVNFVSCRDSGYAGIERRAFLVIEALEGPAKTMRTSNWAFKQHVNARGQAMVGIVCTLRQFSMKDGNMLEQKTLLENTIENYERKIAECKEALRKLQSMARPSPIAVPRKTAGAKRQDVTRHSQATQARVVEELQRIGGPVHRTALMEATGLGESTVTGVLTTAVRQGSVARLGEGRYQIVSTSQGAMAARA